MTVSEGPGTHNEKELKRKYPVTEGLTLGTTKIEGKRPYLSPSGLNGKKTIINKRTRKGI